MMSVVSGTRRRMMGGLGGKGREWHSEEDE